MAKKKMHVMLLLDESGSMSSCLEATIDGYNEYINSLEFDDNADFLFSLIKFEGENILTIHDSRPVKDVPDLNKDTYIPRGMTPLYDAIGKGIKILGRKKNVLFVILTDGMENRSRDYTKDDTFKMIEEKTDQGWSFIYLGANQDAFSVGRGLGIAEGNTMNYNTQNTGETFDAIARGTTCYAVNGGQTMSFFEDAKIDEKELTK